MWLAAVFVHSIKEIDCQGKRCVIERVVSAFPFSESMSTAGKASLAFGGKPGRLVSYPYNVGAQ